jgi:hypothetical protein
VNGVASSVAEARGMNTRRRLPYLVLVLAAGSTMSGSVPGARAAEPTGIAPISRSTPIAVHHGVALWSRQDSRGRYRLVQRVGNGPVTQFRVPSRGVPFDVDVGPASDGRLIAVYSRCRVEPPTIFYGTPEYQKGRGCDVYRLDLRTLAEDRYRAVSSSEATEYWPTYWKGRVGFARAYDRKPNYPYLYVRTIMSSEPSSRMPGGQRKECSTVTGAGGSRRYCSDDSRSTPAQLELYGRRLGFAWRYQGNGESPQYEIRVDTIGGGHQRLDAGGGGGLTLLILGWPSFENGRIYWSRACFADTGGCINLRRSLVKDRYAAGGAQLRAQSPNYVLSHERDSTVTWILRDTTGVGDCQGDPPVPAGTCRLEPLRPDYEPVD